MEIQSVRFVWPLIYLIYYHDSTMTCHFCRSSNLVFLSKQCCAGLRTSSGPLPVHFILYLNRIDEKKCYKSMLKRLLKVCRLHFSIVSMIITLAGHPTYTCYLVISLSSLTLWICWCWLLVSVTCLLLDWE